MKKLRIFLTTTLLLFVLAFAGCQGKDVKPTIDDTDIFEAELEPLTEEEVEALEEAVDVDEEMTAVDEVEFDKLEVEPVKE